MPEIILHLGAHKTATTTVQRTLVKNSALLAENGVLAPKIKDFRDNITRNLIRLRFNRTRSWPLSRILENEFDAAQIDACHRIILSDENIIGYVDQIFNKGRFYTDINKRSALLSKWLPQPPNKIVFSIRPYVGFFRSAYGQWIGLDNKFGSREQAQATVLSIKRGWHDIVADIQMAFPDAQIIVTQYRRRPEFTAQQLLNLTGLPETELNHDKKMFWNKGMTVEDLTEMETGLATGAIDQETIDGLRKKKIMGWPKNNGVFWDDQAKQFLEQKFQHDKAIIAAMPSILSQM